MQISVAIITLKYLKECDAMQMQGCKDLRMQEIIEPTKSEGGTAPEKTKTSASILPNMFNKLLCQKPLP